LLRTDFAISKMSSDESTDSRRSSSSFEGSETESGVGESNVITPWRFEPARRQNETNSREDEVDEVIEDQTREQNRLRNNEWYV